jgi:hypothetical protein
MSQDLALARKAAWTLSRSLMASVILFRVDDQFGFVEATEFDGEEASIIHEYDPYA